jgi:hypothetical protein
MISLPNLMTSLRLRVLTANSVTRASSALLGVIRCVVVGGVGGCRG